MTISSPDVDASAVAGSALSVVFSVEGADASSVAAVTLASACDAPALATVNAGSLTAASTTASLPLPPTVAAGSYVLRVAIVAGKGAGARSAVRAITVTAAPGVDQCAATTGPSEWSREGVMAAADS